MTTDNLAGCRSCADQTVPVQSTPDHRAEISRIRRISGQLNGIENMILEGRYCPDILMQTKAISSALRSLEASLLSSVGVWFWSSGLLNQ